MFPIIFVHVCVSLFLNSKVFLFSVKNGNQLCYGRFLNFWLAESLAYQMILKNQGLVRMSIMKNIFQVFKSINIVEISSPFPIRRINSTKYQFKYRLNFWRLVSDRITNQRLVSRIQKFSWVVVPSHSEWNISTVTSSIWIIRS